MSVDTQKIIEIVKQVKPLFLDREGSSQIKVKGVADFVTQIDFKVQEQVKTALYELYPEIQFMGEEKDNSDIDFDGDVWILDPVDGTTNLIHDFRNSTLSLALARKGVLTLGIIYHPYSDEIFVAERGKGALLNGSPISVSKRQNFSECLISIGTSPYYRELAKENFRIFEKVFTDCADIRRLGSAALELAYVAADEAVLNEKGVIDIEKLKAIAYDPAGSNYIAASKIVGKAFSAGIPLMNKGK